MTILPWLTNTEDVTGITNELGKDCKQLDKLYDKKAGRLPVMSLYMKMTMAAPTYARMQRAY